MHISFQTILALFANIKVVFKLLHALCFALWVIQNLFIVRRRVIAIQVKYVYMVRKWQENKLLGDNLLFSSLSCCRVNIDAQGAKGNN